MHQPSLYGSAPGVFRAGPDRFISSQVQVPDAEDERRVVLVVRVQ